MLPSMYVTLACTHESPFHYAMCHLIITGIPSSEPRHLPEVGLMPSNDHPVTGSVGIQALGLASMGVVGMVHPPPTHVHTCADAWVLGNGGGGTEGLHAGMDKSGPFTNGHGQCLPMLFSCLPPPPPRPELQHYSHTLCNRIWLRALGEFLAYLSAPRSFMPTRCVFACFAQCSLNWGF